MDSHEQLWLMFQNVNEWLKFAEKKNGYLLTVIAIEAGFFKSYSEIPVTRISLIVALFICGASFFPTNRIVHWIYNQAHSSDAIKPDDNLVFYGHISKYTPTNFIDRLEAKYGLRILKDKYLHDLAAQIVINAGIADLKYKYFKVSFFVLVLTQAFLFFSI
jgi:hypothetical protein